MSSDSQTPAESNGVVFSTQRFPQRLLLALWKAQRIAGPISKNEKLPEEHGKPSASVASHADVIKVARAAFDEAGLAMLPLASGQRADLVGGDVVWMSWATYVLVFHGNGDNGEPVIEDAVVRIEGPTMRDPMREPTHRHAATLTYLRKHYLRHLLFQVEEEPGNPSEPKTPNQTHFHQAPPPASAPPATKTIPPKRQVPGEKPLPEHLRPADLDAYRLIDRLPDRGRALVGTALSVASPREVDGLAGDWSNVRDELESDERERGDLAFVARRTELVAGTKAGKLLEKQWTVLMDRRKQFTERDFVCLAKRLLELFDQVGKPKPEGATEIEALEVPA